MKRVYVAAPLGSGVYREPNRLRAQQWVLWVAEQGHCPIADWTIISQFWTEERREQGLRR